MEYPVVFYSQCLGTTAPHPGDSGEQLLEDILAGHDHCIPTHKCCPGRVGPQVQRADIRILCANPHPVEADPQSLGAYLRENGGRALADFCSLDEQDRGCSVLADLDNRVGVGKHRLLHERLWFFLRVALDLAPVDGVPGTRYKSAAADSDPLACRKLSVFLAPARFLPDVFERSLELAASDIQVIACPGVWSHGIPEPYLDRVDPEVIRDHAQKTLEGKTGLRCPVAAHGSAGRLISHHSETFVLVIGEMVKSGNHAAGIIGRDDAER